MVPEIRCAPYRLDQSSYAIFSEQSDLSATVPFPPPLLAEAATPKYRQHLLFGVPPARASSRLQEHPEVGSISPKHVLRVKVSISLSHLLAWLVRVLDAAHLKL